MTIKNRLSIAFAATAILSSSAVFAQEQAPQQGPPQQQMQQQPMQQPMPRKTPEQKAQNQTRWMEKNLMITEDQSRKVYDIILNGAREEEQASMNQQKGEKKEIKRDEVAELRRVLNPDQFQRYMAHVKEQKEKSRERKAAMQQQY